MRFKHLHDLAKPGETPIRTLARVHHEAFLVESLGLKESGISPHQFMRLVQAGVLSDKAPTSPPLGNPFELVIRAAEDFAGMKNKERAEAKTWTSDQWRKRLAAKPLGDPTHDSGPETIILPGGLPEQRWGHKSVDDLQHEVQEMFHAPAEARAVVPGTKLSGYQKDAYVQALERAGMYCTRLGEIVGDELEGALGSDVVAGRLKRIRRKVADAIANGWTKQQLAQELHSVGGWERDWMRVAETELQGAYNDAAVLAAVKQQGPDASVARIPETSACSDCKRLFLEEGKPIIFKVIALIKNGTNVDVPRPQWKATIWPIHPRCRCGLVPVPPGHTVDRSGNVTPAAEQ